MENTPPAETKIPLTVVRATLDQMDHADRQLLSELKVDSGADLLPNR